MWRAVSLAIRAGFVAVLLLVALWVLPWMWPEADHEMRRLFVTVENTVRAVTERVADRLGLEGKGWPW